MRYALVVGGVGIVLSLLSACASMDPRKAELELKQTLPAMKVTSYTQALGDLGLMTEVYGSPTLKLQSNPIGDNTGTSGSTGGEIPRDITEMMKSALNAIGGKVVYIPFDPNFMQSQVATGYGTFSNKAIPDVVLTGGITEFDRALETRGENTDASVGADINGLPFETPSKDAGLRYSAGTKTGVARITLDFNLLDYQTMTGIAKRNTVNSMEVLKGSREQEVGVSLFGQTFGGKGSLKKVQGRHAAVRLLVELSMIQMVGKHLQLPYWRVLTSDVKPDKVVIDAMAEYYRCLTRSEKIANIQEWLYLYGYNTEINGSMDEVTVNALKSLHFLLDPAKPDVDFKTFLQVYLNIPITEEAKNRRRQLSWKR